MNFLIKTLAVVATVTCLAGLSSAASIHDPEWFFTEDVRNFSLLGDNEDAKLTVPEIIAKYGYPIEVHDVETEDGFILQLHRIPYGRKCGPAEGKRAVFVQHGLLCDSSNWVLSGPEKSLAYLLADACYDVFLGNARGNTYSRRHKYLDPVKDKEVFWDFSFHEMGIYDLPANIDYILEKTGNEKIFYIGHSMGTTMFFIAMSERPEYNSKIELMSALAPVAHTEHMISPLRLIAPLANQLQWLLRNIGLYEFFPSDDFYRFMGGTICNETSPYQPICSNILFLICGFNPDQIDAPLLPLMLGHLPAGTSVSTVVHYAQGVPSGMFRRFDHGPEKNMERYGQSTPPEYDLKKITAPTALYWAQNDWLGTVPDTYRIAGYLPNLQVMTRVPHDKFNHLDFLIARDIKTLLNERVIAFMENFRE